MISKFFFIAFLLISLSGVAQEDVGFEVIWDGSVEQDQEFGRSISFLYGREFEEFELGLSYDPELIKFLEIEAIGDWPIEDFDISIDEDQGLISIYYKETVPDQSSYRQFLGLYFKAIGPNFSCATIGIVDIDGDTPIRARKNGVDYFKDDLILTNGEVYIKNEEDDPIRQFDFSQSPRAQILSRVEIDNKGCRGCSGAISPKHFLKSDGLRTLSKYDHSGELISKYEFNSYISSEAKVLFDYQREVWIIIDVNQSGYKISLSRDDKFTNIFSSNTYFHPGGTLLKFNFALHGESLMLVSRSGDGFLIYFINVNDILDELPNPRFKVLEFAEEAFYPDDHFWYPVSSNNPNLLNSEKPMMLALNDNDWFKVDGDYLKMVSFDLDWSNTDLPGFESIEIPLTIFDNGFSKYIQTAFPPMDLAFQKVNDLQQPQYYRFEDHESLLFCFPTDVTAEGTTLGIRWYELRKELGQEWKIHQEGTFAVEGWDYRYNAEIRMDEQENIILAYHCSQEGGHINVGVTGRKKNDPLGIMTCQENILAEGSTYFPIEGRGSMYNQVTVDPIQEGRFWLTANYGGGDIIRALDFNRPSVDLLLSELDEIEDVALHQETEDLKLKVKNVGVESVDGFRVEVYLDGSKVIEDSFEQVIEVNEERLINLNQKLNVPESGTYKLEIILVKEDDAYLQNNEFAKNIYRLDPVDADLEWEQTDVSCNTDAYNEIVFKVRNQGFQNIERVFVEVYVNGVIEDGEVRNTNLEYGERVRFTSIFTDSLLLENEVEVLLKQVVSDGVLHVLEKSLVVPYFKTKEEFKVVDLEVYMDHKSYGTSWSIYELDTRKEVAKGGPYFETLRYDVQKLCLSPYHCYVFEVRDADGIVGFSNSYAYQIKTDFFTTLIEENGDFEDSVSHDFCLDEIDCQINPTIKISPASSSTAANGSLEIEMLNRPEKFEYQLVEVGSFQASSLFENLKSGWYSLRVRSLDGECEFENQVFVGVGTVGVGSSTEMEKGISIFPNPNNGNFVLNIESNLKLEQGSIRIFELNGSQVIARKVDFLNGQQVALDMSHLPKGIYIIKCLVEGKTYVGKAVKLEGDL